MIARPSAVVFLSPVGVPEEDFWAWVAYVEDHINEACECRANVWPVAMGDDKVTSPDESTERLITDWLKVAWGDFCSEESPE